MEAEIREKAASYLQKSELPTVAGAKQVAALRRALLKWYGAQKRDLPWRLSVDPYGIWLSEIMLQQTRVAAVLAYYPVFLARFPSVEKLAAAPLNRVLAAWSGLGYYRRARSLHRAAQQIVSRHQGCLPSTVAELRALPGIGRYTAAAIASIAFGLPVAVVDGNVERVLARFEALPPDSKADYWTRAESLLDRHRPGDWNQAMMELGATVCLPREPQCTLCPLRRWCQWPRAEGALKVSKNLPVRRQSREAYLLARRDRSVYLVRRAAQSPQMAGMWELPRLPHPPAGCAPLFRLRHSITVTDYEIAVFTSGEPAGGRWIRLTQLPELPLTGLARKVLRRAGCI